MNPTNPHLDAKSWQEGYATGSHAGMPTDNPHVPETGKFASWLAGFGRGHANAMGFFDSTEGAGHGLSHPR